MNWCLLFGHDWRSTGQISRRWSTGYWADVMLEFHEVECRRCGNIMLANGQPVGWIIK